jgi:LmbE family N-acetylglucosaminyl deacetylase
MPSQSKGGLRYLYRSYFQRLAVKNIPLSQRTLVVVAHPDDEAGGCGALLQRMRDPIVVFSTDGAPSDPFFWSEYGSRKSYAALRRREAERALAVVGVHKFEFLSDVTSADCSFVDQRLYRVLPQAIQQITRIAQEYCPDALLTLAYEGGHPDHDACSFIAAVVGSTFSLPVWEMPLYHRSSTGALVCRRFAAPNGTEWFLEPNEGELARRRSMLQSYQSQGDLVEFVSSASDAECFRPQFAYDYSQPPHRGSLNYEQWQWPITGADVCAAFVAYSQGAACAGSGQGGGLVGGLEDPKLPHQTAT